MKGTSVTKKPNSLPIAASSSHLSNDVAEVHLLASGQHAMQPRSKPPIKAAANNACATSAVFTILKNYDALPDSAEVRLPIVMALYGCSAATVWRGVKAGRIPAPRKHSPRITSWNVGELRAAKKRAA